ncbi:Uncharacterised protein [Vibrio cholerae]|nr:Uncharacterised protein [Vibrio cholerae]
MKSIPTQLGVAGFKGISHGCFSIGLRYDQKTHHSEMPTMWHRCGMGRTEPTPSILQ